MNTVYVIGVTAAALTLALLAVPPTDLTLARDKNEPVIRAPHDVPALPARDDAAPPQQPANYSPEELDRTMVRIPAGPFLFGMTDQEKQAAAKEAGVHPDMLRHHSSRQLLTTKEFWSWVSTQWPASLGWILGEGLEPGTSQFASWKGLYPGAAIYKSYQGPAYLVMNRHLSFLSHFLCLRFKETNDGRT